MKDITELLRKKETELQQLQRDVEALRIASRLLQEEADTIAPAFTSRSGGTSAPYIPPPRPGQPSVSTAGDAGYGAPWDAASKKFP